MGDIKLGRREAMAVAIKFTSTYDWSRGRDIVLRNGPAHVYPDNIYVVSQRQFEEVKPLLLSSGVNFHWAALPPRVPKSLIDYLRDVNWSKALAESTSNSTP